MIVFPRLLLKRVRNHFRSRAALHKRVGQLEREGALKDVQIEILLRGGKKRVRLTRRDRVLLTWLCRTPGVRRALVLVKPETVLRWHRAGFRLWWRWKSRARGGRPKVSRELRALIARMSQDNPLWGAPRIHGELLSSASTSPRRPSRNT